MARPVEGRAAFLAESCAGDEALRHEVESLLAQQSAAVGFMSTPAVALVGGTMDASPSFVGRRLGPYAITERITEGGMGEVYRARDSKLGRDVAIKILPHIFTRGRMCGLYSLPHGWEGADGARVHPHESHGADYGSERNISMARPHAKPRFVATQDGRPLRPPVGNVALNVLTTPSSQR